MNTRTGRGTNAQHIYSPNGVQEETGTMERPNIYTEEDNKRKTDKRREETKQKKNKKKTKTKKTPVWHSNERGELAHVSTASPNNAAAACVWTLKETVQLFFTQNSRVAVDCFLFFFKHTMPCGNCHLA